MAANICRWNSDWPFLSTPDVPKIDFSDPLYAELKILPQPYHRELALFLRDHKPAFKALKEKSTVGIYNLLLKHNTPKVEKSGQEYWNKETQRQLPWKSIWKNTYRSLDNSHYLDVYYKFLHNAHATGNNLLQSGGNYDTSCPTCQSFETTLHAFAACSFPRRIWNRYYYIYAELQEMQNLSYGDILFSLHLPSNKNKRLLVLTITNVILHEIWRARCAAKHPPYIPIDIDLSTFKINARIKQIHWAYFKCNGDFSTILCLPSPVCKEENGTLIFDLPTAQTFNIYGDESDITSDDYFISTSSISNSSRSTDSSEAFLPISSSGTDSS